MTWAKGGVALLAAALSIGAAPARETATLIVGARIFDGTGSPAFPGNVLIRGDRILAVGAGVKAPRGARIVQARGLTLLPGLHDLHTHLRSPAIGGPDDLPKAYAGYLVHGLTSVVDFSVSGEMLQPIRELTDSGAIKAPNLSLAVRIGVPGGHGTEYGWGPDFTLEAVTPREAELAMARALSYRPDVIKVFADGWRYGRGPDLNSMNLPTLAAIVKAAHAADVPVITHTVTLQGAKVAASAGVDALGHGIGDALVDDELIRLMKANGTAYVPTMAVYEPQALRAFAPAEWQLLRPQERAREEAGRREAAGQVSPVETRRWAILQANVGRLKAGGVRFGVGTDAGIGGVFHGNSTLREIGLLARLGLGPAQALAAATGGSAAILRRSGTAGRIAAGQRADILLVGGAPDRRIEDLFDIRRVFVAGREVPLAATRAARDGDRRSPLPALRMAGPIDTGRGSGGRTDLGTLPVTSYEAGADHSRLHVARQANGRLLMVGRLGAAPQPFAHLALPLTRGAVRPANASGFTGIAFTARGSGRFALLVDSYSADRRDAFRAAFSAGETAAEVRLPFSAFAHAGGEARLDPSRLRALIFRLEGERQTRPWLELGDIRFYR